MIRAALFAAALLAVSFTAVADRDDDDRDHHRDRDRERSFDPVYNVCRGTDPVCYNDWGVQGRKANRVILAQLVQREVQGQKATRAIPVLKGQRVMMEQLVRLATVAVGDQDNCSQSLDGRRRVSGRVIV